MKITECENCGSHSFHKNGNQFTCDYCHTMYINEGTFTIQIKKIWKNIVFLSMLILFFIRCFSFVNDENSKAIKRDYLTQEKNNMNTSDVNKVVDNWQKTLNKAGISEKDSQSSDVSSLKTWTQSIYDTLAVATKSYDDQAKKYKYTNGSNFDQIVKKVGQPDSNSIDRDTSYGMPVRVRATWDNDDSGKNAGVVITLTYIESNKMIINKELEYY